MVPAQYRRNLRAVRTLNRTSDHITPQGTQLARFNAEPGGVPRAQLLLAHGFGEHAGRYQPLANALTARGFALHALDHLGHGHSPGQRAFVPAAGRLAADFRSFAEAVQAEKPDVPIVLFGHSMGGAVAAQVALQAPELFSGLILSAPYLQPGRAAPAILRSAVALLARIAPHVGVEKIPASQLSRIPEQVAAYDSDPLVFHGSVPARSAHSLLTSGAWVLQNAAVLQMPLLILHGGADSIAASSGSTEFHARAESDDKTLRIIDDGRHELLNDLSSAEFLTELLSWLDSRFVTTETNA